MRRLAPLFAVLAATFTLSPASPVHARPTCRTITVLDRNDHPLARAEVSLSACNYYEQRCPNPIPTTAWQTDRNGRVCAEELLTERDGALEVTAPDRQGAHCAAEKHWSYPKAFPGTAPIVVKLDAPRLPTARLEGRVTSAADGRAIAGAQVNLESVVVHDDCVFNSDAPAATTSADGRFSIRAVPRGIATLRLTHPAFAPRTLTVAVPAPRADLVLDDGASWRGRVVDPDGRALSDCDVIARAAGEMILGSSTCAEGAFELRHLPPGEVEIGVRTSERSQLGGRSMKVKTSFESAEQRQRDIAWPKGVTLAGTIVDLAGAPIAEARISAVPRGAERPPSQFHPKEVMVRADAAGRFVFPHMEPGPWTLEGDYRTSYPLGMGKLEVDGTKSQDGLRFVGQLKLR